ncbi:hypothetical protein [Micromonospora endolithica]|uniref:Uncharacterized protein n=1 Tax=Micromonospora endolithica TaxID=230091 RepID=A0A3A9Z584_9ACTN|nr:hypothetical protein [Micromonospora endolithica]RKN43423.1 hypothetical protein D7223_20415 [Micromonospora endolithica]TWJ23990.1 hypothetical protein JD76_04136 [Micromonospora endolithica]
MRNLRLAVPALAVCMALGACGGQGGGDGTPTSTPTGDLPVTSQPTPDPSVPPTAGPTPPTAAPTPPPPSLPPLPTGKPGKPTLPPPVGGTELTGTIATGVEPNCLLLDGFLLIGGPRDVLRPGARVTVTGQVQPDVMSTCQQGTPFVVENARRS